MYTVLMVVVLTLTAVLYKTLQLSGSSNAGATDNL
jgi:hypothetical protein